MMTWARWLSLLVVSGLIAGSSARAGAPVGVGVLGDSYSDEYQFYPPDRSTGRNWMEILAATRGLNFGTFSTAGRGEPRNQGFAYNWSRSGATTSDLIAAGQHTGVAAQVVRGEVGIVWLFIGGNDFIQAMHAADPHAALAEALPRALANEQAAVDTVLGASSDVKLVLVTIPDIRSLPEFRGRLTRELADDCIAAIDKYNARIKAIALESPSRIALIDFARVVKVADAINRDSCVVAGRRLDRRRPGNEPGCFFLADGRHPGTIAQGLLAKLFIGAVNTKFGAGIPPLQDSEVVQFASSHPAPGNPSLVASEPAPRVP